MKEDLLSRKADYIGITGSVLCIIHCLVTPLLLIGSSLLKEDVFRFGYLSLDYVFIGINIIAVYFATRHLASPIIKACLWSFLSLFTLAMLLENVSDVFTYMGYVASAGLVTTHLANIRSHRLQHAR